MIDAVFKENLIKNKVLDINSNKFNVIKLDYVDGEVELINTKSGTNFGYIFISVKNNENFKMYFEDILILNKIDDFYDFIPMSFSKSGRLKIIGKCGNIIISINGANFMFDNKNLLLPLLSSVYLCNGSKRFAKYSDIYECLQGDLNEFENVSDTIGLQSVRLQGQDYIGKVIKSNAVYFCTGMDNYTSKKYICDNADEIVFFQSDIDDFKCVYRFEDKWYLKCNDASAILIDIYKDKVPTKVVVPQINSHGVCVFGLYFSDGSVDLMILGDMQINKLLTIKGDIIKIIINGNCVYVISIKNYLLNVSIYTVDQSKDIKNMLFLQDMVFRNNILDACIVDDKLIYYSNGQSYSEESFD